MAQPTSGARSISDANGTRDSGRGGLDARDDGRHTGLTPAQWYCLLAGAALLLAGIFGFIADGSFDTASSIDKDMNGNANGMLQGDSFLGFEVNGWHNLVHILSGLVLLASFRLRSVAKTVALVFGIVYGIVALIGLIDGNDVLGLIPVNPADNILHIALSAVGILAALASPTDEHDRNRKRTHQGAGVTTSDRGDIDGDGTITGRDGRFGRDVDPLSGEPRRDDQITGTRPPQ